MIYKKRTEKEIKKDEDRIIDEKDIKINKFKDNMIHYNHYYGETLQLIQLELKDGYRYKLGSLNYEILMLFSINLIKFQYSDNDLNMLYSDNFLIDYDILNPLEILIR